MLKHGLSRKRDAPRRRGVPYVASMLAAEGFDCAGLLLAAYPLHPAGQPEKLRHAHLPKIRCPVLCLNGTRDQLCRRDLMEEALKAVTAARLMGADCIISGIRPLIAQTIVHLGLDLSEVTTKSSLADAVTVALERTGHQIVRRKTPAPE